MARRGRCLLGPLLSLALVAPALGAPTIFKLQTRPTTAGAEIVVDGAPAGTTNAQGALFVSVEAGRHRVQVIARGATIADRVHDFEADLNHVAVDVRAPRVKVLIDAKVAGATVSVDGRATATTARDGRALLELPGSARYAIRVTKTGFEPAVARLDLRDVDHKLALKLSALPAATPPPALPAPPRALWQAADAFLHGDYPRVLEVLAAARFEDRRARAEAELFRAAAHHALHRLGTAGSLVAATEAVERCRALAPELRPDREVFPPRFVAFFAAPREAAPPAR